MTDLRRCKVYVRSVDAGILSETDEGYSFKYNTEYLKSADALPVSLTLPLAETEYKSTTLFSFFDGLIPEGWLLDVACRNWKIDRHDRFGLLSVCCVDCIGDVSVEGIKPEVPNEM